MMKKYDSFETTTLEESRQREAEQEIGETPETRRSALLELKKRLKDHKDLEPNLDDSFLLRFLRHRKFDVQKTIDRMLRFYQVQDKLVDYFKYCSIAESTLRNIRYCWMSPYRLKNGSSIIIAKSGNVDYSVISFAERLSLEMMMINSLLENHLNQICGMNVIIDYSGFSRKDVLVHTPRSVYYFLDTLQNAVPVRVKSVHLVNVSTIVYAILKIIQPLLSKKTKDRLFVHPRNDWTSLHSCIPAEILPEEYGGELRESDMIDLLSDSREKERLYREQLRFGYLDTRDQRRALTFLAF